MLQTVFLVVHKFLIFREGLFQLTFTSTERPSSFTLQDSKLGGADTIFGFVLLIDDFGEIFDGIDKVKGRRE